MSSKNSSIILKTGTLAEIKTHGAQLSKLKKDNSILLLAKTVEILEGIYIFCNIKRDIDPKGIMIIADEIIKDFWYLKIEELDYAIKNGMKGQYGKVLDRIDGNIIYSWLHGYEKSEEVLRVAEAKGENFKGEENKGRNTSILEMPEFRDRVMKDVLHRPPIQKYTEEEKEAHRAMIRKQADEVMKNGK